ncbi:Transmembrane protein 232 [Trichoplax sp. H2]|nr:Transmembrane protein 232 [Trichoplax sp. H2]|eukprot:RDD40825.1 Transmembrane protein 232 [Trichoplax sp. H2]
MPIHKIPIVHKFGIVSLSHREELQERINKRYLEIPTKPLPKSPKKFDYDVEEDFISKFNSSIGTPQHKNYEESADKALQRLIRRAGIKSGGMGQHINLPRAWCELSMLAQCQGRVREDSLEILITSLDQAPLNEDHLSSLFYLAEVSIYWLKKSAVSKPLLRSAEIKLMKLASSVFLRIFCYYCLKVDLSAYAKDLSKYAQGFEVCQEAYRAFPGSRMLLKFIADISKALISTYNHKIEEQASGSNDIMNRESFMAAMHNVSPTLWHSIDVWRCITHLSGGKKKALKALQVCATCIATEPWVDIVLALQIIGDACQTDIDVLKVLHDIAIGNIPEDYIPVDEALPYIPRQYDNLGSSDRATGQYSHHLSDTFAEGVVSSDSFTSLDKMFTPTTAAGSQDDTNNNRQGRLHSSGSSQTQSHTNESRSGNRSPTSYSHTTKTTEVCDDFNVLNQYGIKGWPWELGYVYAETLTSICLYGKTSDIQQLALYGNRDEFKRGSKVTGSYGLLDLLTFEYIDDTQEAAEGRSPFFHLHFNNSARDRSWRIRAAAVHGLLKVCQYFHHDPSREGFYNVAWAALNEHKLKEIDIRVLEAYKVGQFDADADKKRLSIVPLYVSNALVKHVAFLFSKTFLHQLPPPVKLNPQKPKKRSRIYNKVPKRNNITKSDSNRLTLREHLLISSALYKPPMDFKTRANINFNQVIERQWRKELHAQLDEDTVEWQVLENQKKLDESKIGKDYKEKTFPPDSDCDPSTDDAAIISESKEKSTLSTPGNVKIIRDYKKKDLELLHNLKTNLDINDNQIVDLNRKHGNKLQHDQLIKVKLDTSVYTDALSVNTKSNDVKKLREVSATLPVLPEIKSSTASTK